MAGSLQDQLLGIGLVDKKKAKKISTQKRKQEKASRKNNTELVDEAGLLADAAVAAEKENSKALNEQQKQQAEQKAIVAQIKQMIEMNKVDKAKGDIAYNFVDAGKVKVMYVTEALRTAIGRGQLVIVKLAAEYELVPFEVAKKISERDGESVIELSDNQSTLESAGVSGEEDPYAKYEIPDDLMW